MFGRASASSGRAEGLARPASHAGSWYEGTKERLTRYYTHVIELATQDHPQSAAPSERIAAVVGPHAGLSYCGETSARAYYALQQYAQGHGAGAIRRVFLLGPSHHKYIEGVEYSAFHSYDTPMGELGVDTDAVAEVAKQCNANGVPACAMERDTDEEEHSLELHLPFVVGALGDRVRVVPVLVGDLSAAQEATMGRLLRPYLNSKENLFVVSTDFCHWGSRFRYNYHFRKDAYPNIADAIEAMDREAMRLISSNDLNGWYSYLNQTKNTICGRHPVSVLLHTLTAASKKSEGQGECPSVQFVHYAQSNRCQSLQDSQVSYASGIVKMPL